MSEFLQLLVPLCIIGVGVLFYALGKADGKREEQTKAAAKEWDRQWHGIK